MLVTCALHVQPHAALAALCLSPAACIPTRPSGTRVPARVMVMCGLDARCRRFVGVCGAWLVARAQISGTAHWITSLFCLLGATLEVKIVKGKCTTSDFPQRPCPSPNQDMHSPLPGHPLPSSRSSPGAPHPYPLCTILAYPTTYATGTCCYYYCCCYCACCFCTSHPANLAVSCSI